MLYADLLSRHAGLDLKNSCKQSFVLRVQRGFDVVCKDEKVDNWSKRLNQIINKIEGVKIVMVMDTS